MECATGGSSDANVLHTVDRLGLQDVSPMAESELAVMVVSSRRSVISWRKQREGGGGREGLTPKRRLLHFGSEQRCDCTLCTKKNT